MASENVCGDRIAFVDDEEALCTIAELQLKDEYPDAEIMTFMDPYQFLDVHRRRPFDICIMDYSFKGNGTVRKIWPLIRRANPSVKIIVFSGWQGKELESEVFIAKPTASIAREVKKRVDKLKDKSPLALGILDGLIITSLEMGHNGRDVLRGSLQAGAKSVC